MTRQLVAERLQPKGHASEEISTYGALKCLGVAARSIDGHRGPIPHAGILYRKKKEIRLFEMRSHKELQDVPAPGGFVWVEPAFAHERMQLVAGRLRLVHAQHQKNGVPYGFRWTRSAFDEKGGFRLGEGEIGFTCSTIVTALLESEGLRLVRPETWPAPDEADKKARKDFIEFLRAKDADHAKVLLADIDAPRICPEEIVAAAALAPEVGTFETVQDGAAAVRARIGT